MVSEVQGTGVPQLPWTPSLCPRELFSSLGLPFALCVMELLRLGVSHQLRNSLESVLMLRAFREQEGDLPLHRGDAGREGSWTLSAGCSGFELQPHSGLGDPELRPQVWLQDQALCSSWPHFLTKK